MVKGAVNLPLLAAWLASDGQWSWAQGLPGPCQLGSTADAPSSGPATAAVAADATAPRKKKSKITFSTNGAGPTGGQHAKECKLFRSYLLVLSSSPSGSITST